MGERVDGWAGERVNGWNRVAHPVEKGYTDETVERAGWYARGWVNRVSEQAEGLKRQQFHHHAFALRSESPVTREPGNKALALLARGHATQWMAAW